MFTRLNSILVTTLKISLSLRDVPSTCEEGENQRKRGSIKRRFVAASTHKFRKDEYIGMTNEAGIEIMKDEWTTYARIGETGMKRG